MALLEIRNVVKRFGDFTAVNHVSLSVNAGEFFTLLGPSGCGKTTLLRIIAGLETADAGQVLFHGEDATQRPVSERQVGFVFQHYALFRHMSVFDNVAFGLSVRPRASRPAKADIRERVMRLLKLVQLDWLADAYPDQLSGGQRQRIALARSLAVEPRVLLLDEPFGALDAFTREELWCILRDLWTEQQFNVILVTHDLRESVFLADTVYVMSKSPGRFVVKKEIELPRPRDLEVTYTKEFTDIVHELRGPAQVAVGRRISNVVASWIAWMPMAMSSSSGCTSCGATGSALAGEPSNWPASTLMYQPSSTSATIGQLDTSTPSGARKVKALRRRGSRPMGAAPNSAATSSAQAPAASTTVRACTTSPFDSVTRQASPVRVVSVGTAPVSSRAPACRAPRRKPCSMALTSMS